MLVLVAIITWVVTHGEVTRLTTRIAEQESQLQRFHHYQQVLSEQQPPVERKLRFDWQIAAWANQLSLQLTFTAVKSRPHHSNRRCQRPTAGTATIA